MKCLNNDIQKIQDEEYVKNCLKIAFYKTSKDLMEESEIDCSFSGCTCVVILMVYNNVYCANIGDSRSIMGS